ncbi:MAG: ABC transporter ATP-binding protein [Actinomycetota bacterium]
MNVIETYGLTKSFGTLVAVNALDLEVTQGEVFGYLGPNGAGKSTTIRMLLDFLRPTSGTYEVLGGTGADPAIRARIGYLPGELRFDPRYTANDLIDLYGHLRGGVVRERVDALLERFALDPTRRIGQLSSGNKRKVAIVQAFMHGPELLILDEPTQGLDPLLQHEFQALIGEVVKDGATVFLSSHVLPEVETLAHRIGILRHGNLVTTTTIANLERHARQQIELHVAGKATVRAFEELPNVIDAWRTGNVITVLVAGPVDAVIKEAAKLNVRRIYTREADLEEAFLDLYKDADA